MSKANQKINGKPEKGGTDRKENATWLSKAPIWIGLCLFVSMILMGPASAASMNWTSVTEMLDGVVTIFPSITNMVTELVPVLILIAIIGFIMRFLNSIIAVIESATNIFR